MSRELVSLFGADVRAGALARIEALGLRRPEPLFGDGEGEDDPRELLWWLLRMAIATHDAAPEPVETRRLEEVLTARPQLRLEHAQMPIDLASTVRRAAAIEGERVLFVGDDDAASIALLLRGPREVHVFDIDEALLAWLSETARDLPGTLVTHRVDVFEDEPPPALVGRCDAVVTDPIRSLEPCLAFLELGLACLRPGGLLYWADHPDWNVELPLVMAEMRSRDLQMQATRELLHRYVLDGWLEDLPAKAKALGVDVGWLRRLAAAVDGWTHLYVLAIP